MKDTFCSSPWFHLRLTYDGTFQECRWAKNSTNKLNFENTSIVEFYNSDEMKQLRKELLNGDKPKVCETCYYEDSFGKFNGRRRQLVKSGIRLDHFELSLRSSPHYKYFNFSNLNDGQADYYPVDLQIDLSNTCNSACIMCHPMSSSKLVTDYKKLHKIQPLLFSNPKEYRSWTKDPVQLDRAAKEIASIPNLKYIHFLGGETLFDPAFYAICDSLISAGVSKNIIIGTTTNGTIYDSRVEDLIKQFKEFHLGISIESVTELNDYVRYPSNIASVLSNIDKFLALRNEANLQIGLRITPNLFTIYELDKLVDYMVEKNIIAESCNIMHYPQSLCVELLPDDIRKEIINKLDAILIKHNLSRNNIANIRRKDVVKEVIGDVVSDYKSFLETYTTPHNVDQLRQDTVKFLKAFENIRNNSILDYAPRYKDFLRHHGY